MIETTRRLFALGVPVLCLSTNAGLICACAHAAESEARSATSPPSAAPVSIVERDALAAVPWDWSDNGVVVAWSQVAYDIGFAEHKFDSFKGARANAMMHIAMHDALNAVVPVYEQYSPLRRDSRADPVVAAAQAAHDVLLHEYASAEDLLDRELERWLANGAKGARKKRGIDVGQRSAAAILERRAADGWDRETSYAFDPAPGRYRTTPPWNGFVLAPGFRFTKPFALETADQLRPAPPPALGSADYAAAFDEVKAFGRADSAVRTPDQTRYAIWWMEYTDGSVNRLARELVTAQHLHLWRTARLFALLDLAEFDAYVAVWDAKLEYDHWRPYSAIREADADGNAATLPDPTWEPLRPTPPFQDYVSAHGTACAATFDVLARVLGDETAFTMRTLTAPPEMPMRSFVRFSDAANECADSRIRLGWHFRYAATHGLRLGRAVAGFAVAHELRPIGAVDRGAEVSAIGNR